MKLLKNLFPITQRIQKGDFFDNFHPASRIAISLIYACAAVALRLNNIMCVSVEK